MLAFEKVPRKRNKLYQNSLLIALRPPFLNCGCRNGHDHFVCKFGWTRSTVGMFLEACFPGHFLVSSWKILWHLNFFSVILTLY